MAIGKAKLSKQGFEILNKIMAEFDLPVANQRPDTLRIAFAKGLVSEKKVDEPIALSEKSDFEFPLSVITKDDYLLYKHLIINKVGRTLEEKDIEKFILFFVEDGLQIMKSEVDQLSGMDNYLLFLVNAHSSK
ncbi:hypothetical protein CN692_07600 [Bacillus sp. AFS002410]|uniref:DndE family protein n=1 Tax=Bacillus sp. AFS002410 TaxID=2033481 RepID=UPI000BEF97DF|nr:DndE family protein [Bacillus sp. AFS002410]PEJ58832.1 hypothetical protein CN692_07600 [Bacillus sp. AFS002410]